jgi:hypothetical protein
VAIIISVVIARFITKDTAMLLRIPAQHAQLWPASAMGPLGSEMLSDVLLQNTCFTTSRSSLPSSICIIQLLSALIP